ATHYRALEWSFQLRHIGFDNQPALKTGILQKLENGWEIDATPAQFGPDAFVGKSTIVPLCGHAFFHHVWVDIFDVHRLDTIGIVTAELHHIRARPGQVAGVRPHEDDIAIHQRKQAVDLFPRLNRRADVVVETT